MLLYLTASMTHNSGLQYLTVFAHTSCFGCPSSFRFTWTSSFLPRLYIWTPLPSLPIQRHIPFFFVHPFPSAFLFCYQPYPSPFQFNPKPGNPTPHGMSRSPSSISSIPLSLPYPHLESAYLHCALIMASCSFGTPLYASA